MSSAYESPKEKIYSIHKVREGRKKLLILHFSFAAASGTAAVATNGYDGVFFFFHLLYIISRVRKMSGARHELLRL